MFSEEEATLHWVKILCKSEIDKIDRSPEPEKIIFDPFQPDIFEPGEEIYLLTDGYGKCEIIATVESDSEHIVKARPKTIVVDIPRIRSFAMFFETKSFILSCCI